MFMRLQENPHRCLLKFKSFENKIEFKIFKLSYCFIEDA